MDKNRRSQFCATVLYPFSENVSFDYEKYTQSLAPRYAEILGPTCTGFEIRRGLRSPGSDHPAYICIASFWIESAEKFGQAMGDPRMAGLMQEISKFTSIEPIRQFDEILSKD